MKQFLYALGALVIAAGFAIGAEPEDPAADAASGARIEGGTSETALPLLLRGIDLTEEQKGKARDIVQSQRAALQETYKRMRSAQAQLGNRLLSEESLDEDQLATLLEQILFLQNQLARQSFRTTLDIRNLLTPQQLAQGAKYREQLKARQKEEKKN